MDPELLLISIRSLFPDRCERHLAVTRRVPRSFFSSSSARSIITSSILFRRDPRKALGKSTTAFAYNERRESDNDERLSAARQDASQRVANCSARKKRYRAYQTVISRDRRYEARQPSFLLPCWAGIAPFHHRYLLLYPRIANIFAAPLSLSLDIFFEIPCNFENNFLGNRFRF